MGGPHRITHDPSPSAIHATSFLLLPDAGLTGRAVVSLHLWAEAMPARMRSLAVAMADNRHGACGRIVGMGGRC